jgi:hypothetical protein
MIARGAASCIGPLPAKIGSGQFGLWPQLRSARDPSLRLKSGSARDDAAEDAAGETNLHYYPENQFDKPVSENLLYCSPHSTVRQLRYRFSGKALLTCQVRRTSLHFRQLNAEADA